MTPEQWTLVERLYHDASSVPPGDRDAWLARACNGDEVVKREVESLLAQNASTADAFDAGALAQVLGRSREDLTGRQLGGYTFLELIDEGGMGQVYRARDIALPRDVAVKVITPEFADDPLRRTRFRREASILAALTHPHIAHVYAFVEADGRSLLAMELVPGETLAATIRRGRLPLADLLRYGAEIADALAEAHAAGIVHRDLKPGNVMVTGRGIKVLDFGLARHRTASTTQTMTAAVLGTPAYMSPEQAIGAPADARADLFSLGLVIYEMATGALPVPGASLGSMLAHDGSVVVPPPGRVRKGLPPRLDRLVSSLLSARPVDRPASATAVRDELRGIAAGGGVLRRNTWIAAAAVVAILALGSAVAWRFIGPHPPDHFEVTSLLPIAASPGDKTDPSLSPDGASVAFSWKGPTNDKPGIYVARVAGGEPQRLTETTASDVAPAWSPDGRLIAYQRVRPGMPNDLMLVPAQGGPAKTIRTVRALARTSAWGPALSWMRDGRGLILGMIDTETQHLSLFRVDLDGSLPRRVIKGDGETISEPSISPDGRWLAYVNDFSLRVQRLSVDGVVEGEPIEILKEQGLVSPVWSPDARQLLFLRTSQFRIMAWDAAARSLQSVYLVPYVSDRITAAWTGGEGPRVVFSAAGGQLELRTIDVVDHGQRAAGPSRVLFQGAGSGVYSRDGRWIAFSRFSDGIDLWLADANGEHARRLTRLHASALREPMWSPDGRHLAFHARLGSTAQIYVLDIDPAAEMARPADAEPTGVPRRVVETSFDLVSPQWSPDGQYLYVLRPRTSRMMRVPQGGGELEDLFDSEAARVHPSEQRIYYVKPAQRSMFTRALSGDIRSNPDSLVLTDGYSRGGFDITPEGIFYVATNERGEPSAMRFHDFSLNRSFDLAPPPSRNFFPTLRVSPDRRHVIYDTLLDASGGLMFMQLRQRAN